MGYLPLHKLGSKILWSNVVFSIFSYTLTAISVDRLLALLLGLRYRQVVTLRRMCITVIDHVQSDVFRRQPSQAIPLNIARYRKAMNSALWVQGTLVVCYLPVVVFGWR